MMEDNEHSVTNATKERTKLPHTNNPTLKKQHSSTCKKPAIHSDEQIMKLGLEFRRLKRELKYVNRHSYDYIDAEREKVMELLKDEAIPFREELLEDVNPSGVNKEEEIDVLLTNGKIDLDKVLCLHLFSISQPFKCRKGTLEGPNMKMNQLTRYCEYLPCFLVEPVSSTINCACWARDETTFDCIDQSITIHLQVNSQIEKMIHTVINVLKKLNPSKLKNLALQAQSVGQIQCTLEKPENQTFISSLLHSKFIHDKNQMRTEMSIVMQGKTHVIQDIGKFKKNLVFRLDVPESLADTYKEILSHRAGLMKRPVKELAESSFEQLLQMKKRVESNISIIPGYQLLQKGSSTGGIAVIDQTGTSISYLAGQPNERKMKKTTADVTIIMQSPKVNDHEYVIEKMSEMDRSKMILARPRNKVEEVSLRIAKRNMNDSKKLALGDMNYEQLKEEVLKKLSNDERIAIAQKSAKLKKSVINSKGESQSVPIVELLKGTVERHSLLKLVRDSTDIEREVLFKPGKQGGIGIGELLMDTREINVISRLEGMTKAKNVALIEEECNYRVHKKLNVDTDSQFGILKIEQEVSKREILKSCTLFEKRLMTKK